MTATVVSVGSLNVDRTLEVERLPAPGETLLALGSATRCGGKGANQAAAAAAAGASVAMVGCIGDDDAGELMLADLAARSIDSSAVRAVGGVASGSATILVDRRRGENVIVVEGGANGELNEQDVRIDAVAGATVLLCQLEVGLGCVRAAAEHCGGLVVLNAAPADQRARELLDAVDLLVVNQAELAALTAAPVAGSLTEIAGCVRAAGFPCDVVVTAGGAGALVVSGAGQAVPLPAPRVDPLDTTGAGDCFCGVLAARLAAGAALIEAGRDAVAGASLSTLARGARGRLPSLAQIADARQ